MIYLCPEVKSGLGEDTFWPWFEREFAESSFAVPTQAHPEDFILQYATLGPPAVNGGTTVALLWELYPEMKKYGLSHDDEKIKRMNECAAACDIKTVSCRTMQEYYGNDAIVVPIGVDTDLFVPMDKKAMRKKHGFGSETIGFWCGTDHPMKGKDRLLSHAEKHPAIKWIRVSKKDRLPQKKLAELMNCCDFGLFTGRLRPYFMVEWELMACDIPVVDISGCERDFIPADRPRKSVFDNGWSRHQAKERWQQLLCVN